MCKYGCHPVQLGEIFLYKAQGTHVVQREHQMHLGWSALPRQTSCRVLRSHLGNSDDSVHVTRICTCVKIARPRTAGAVASRPCQARVSIVCHHHTSTSSTMAGGSSHPHHKVDTVQRSGLVWGIDRGHKTERRVPATRPSRRKGRQSQRKTVVNSVVREVVGFAPYERRAMELIRNSKVCIGKNCAVWMFGGKQG